MSFRGTNQSHDNCY